MRRWQNSIQPTSLLKRSAQISACQAGTTPGAARATPIPNVTVHADGTVTNAQGTLIVLPTAPAGTGSAVAGTTPGATLATPNPDITVHADGTATNSEGTPVAVSPTAAPVPTGSAVEPTAVPVTPGVASGAIITVGSVADASGEFSVDVTLSGVTQPYVAFNIFVTFDPSIVSSVIIKPGPALAQALEEMLCVKLPVVNGGVGLGCTVFDAGTKSTNGALATITFRSASSGTTPLHLRSLADGGASTGSFIVTPQGTVRKPDIVTLIDGSVSVP